MNPIHQTPSETNNPDTENTTTKTTNNQRTVTKTRKGRYGSLGQDRHPNIPVSMVLMFPKHRNGRIIQRKQIDPDADKSFGDAIIFKDPDATRFLFQNVKGLTFSTSGDDYRYVLSAMVSFSVDVFGMAETNTGWQHPHLQADFRNCAKRQFTYSKTVFGSPTAEIDPLPEKETFQAGGTLQIVSGQLATTLIGPSITDPRGLGRWCGNTYQGKGGNKFTVITGYRTCTGSINSAPLGSTFHREYEFYRSIEVTSPQPRSIFLKELSTIIQELQEQDHSILLMMDANATVPNDKQLCEFLDKHGLYDLHQQDPATSTYIGSEGRRIDFIVGCSRVQEALSRQGSLSYFEGPKSDHRAIYVDLKLSDLLGESGANKTMTASQNRALQAGNPEKVERYISSMHKYYGEHKMVERIDHLYETYKVLPRGQIRKLLTSWDRDQGRAMLAAEAEMMIQPKQYKWSPILRNAGVVMRYWKLRLREQKCAEDYTNTFDRWERQIGEYDSSFLLPLREKCLPIEGIRQHLNQATKALRTIQRRSMATRLSSYQDLLERYEEDEDNETRDESERKAKIVRRTIRSETTRQMFAKIRNVVKPSDSSPLAKIEVPRPHGQLQGTLPTKTSSVVRETLPENLVWDTIITRKEIEEHLVHFNREAFRAASESPCGSGIIHDSLRFTSLSNATKKVLYGEVPAEWYGNDDLLREFLASFTIPSTVLDEPPISTKITTIDIKQGFQSWKETTTTSPSGRHLGHYKAIIQDHTLLQCMRKFMQITIDKGISIPRWCNAVNVMIEKDPGRPRINRLRIIHLFEADYNLFLKIMWGSRLVRRAVKLDLLNQGQHGSVPGRTTMAPIMLNQLTTDLCRILKTNYARFDNDASACFDRIIVALGMMAARRCGMPINAVRTHAKSLQLMKYTVKTVYGVSESSYKGTSFEPLFGTGQGSGASPYVWLTLVVILLNTLDRIVPDRISFRAIDGTIEHRRLVDAFVDDTAVGITDDGQQSLQQLVIKLEKAAQSWEKLLHFSGGALNLQKCSWYVMFWDWRQGRPVLKKREINDPTIKLTQGKEQIAQPIKRLDLDMPSKLLGVYQTPMGDFSAHIQALKSKADKYAGLLRSPRLTQMDTRIFHNRIYTPAMKYSMAALAVDEEELSGIQSRIIPAILNKLGMSRTLPTSIRFGPISMGGIGLLDLRTENGIEMVKYFRHQIHGQTQVGNLLLIQLQASQIEAGIQQPLLEFPDIDVPYLTPTWILSMRRFLSNHNLSITVSQKVHIQMEGKHDSVIMERDRLKQYSTMQQSDINRVRIYLQATTLSDLTDPTDHRKIKRQSLLAERCSDFKNNSAWPRQMQPSKQQQKLWKKYIASQFLRYGLWWRTTPKCPGREVKRNSDDATRQETNLLSMIQQLPRSKRRLLTYVSQPATDTQLWRACRGKQYILIASDGGLKGKHGTFGWNVRNRQDEILLEGAGPVDGPADTANSTRCELGGYAASLIIISMLHALWGIRHRCKFRWVTDSKTSISNVNKELNEERLTKRQPDNDDYLAIIRHETKFIRRPIKPIWVKGHQPDSDDNSTQNNRDIKGNNYADKLATWYRDRSGLPQSRERMDHIAESRISVAIQGKQLTNRIEDCIRYHINGYHLRCYMQEKFNWDNAIWNTLDIEMLGNFIKRLVPAQQTARAKFVFDQWYIGKRRLQRSNIKDPQLQMCPCCKAEEETTAHVLQCQQNPDREKRIRILQKAMASDIHHTTMHLLKEGTIAWLEGKEFTADNEQYPEPFKSMASEAIQEQSALGWEAATKGFLSVRWRTMAELDMLSLENPHEGKGIQRLKRVHKALHTYVKATWEARNQVLHGSDDRSLKALRESEILEIIDLYNHPELVPAGDRHYCALPLEKLLARTPTTRRRWLRHMRQARQRMSNRGQKNQALITKFFRQRDAPE